MTIYLDHAATTPMRASARDAYLEALDTVGNPASIHSTGQAAKQRLEESRERIAASLGCDPIEAILTSGGTESINLAIKGLFWRRNLDADRPVIVVPGGEHHATADTVEWLEQHHVAQIRWLSLDEEGSVDPAELERILEHEGDRCALVSTIFANNEVGTLQPVTDLSRVAARYGIPLHTDAVAAYGYVAVDVRRIRQDSGSTGDAGLVAASVSAHKIGGPVGVGALYLSRGAGVEPLLHGGGQQRQVRSGTQDVAGACAFANAADLTCRDREAEAERLSAMRDRMIAGLGDRIPEARLNGPERERLPGNVHVTFPGCEGDSLLFLLDMAGIAVSTGSACQAGVPEPSHVLIAMGRSEEEARGALRITLGHTTCESDVDALLEALPRAFQQAAKAGFSDRDVAAH